VLDDAVFRTQLAALLTRTGRSQRGLSAAFGRDPGYVQALLDPTRPSRARPTPDDLVRAADVTGLTLVELLEQLWGIEPGRLAAEVARLVVSSSIGPALDALSDAQRGEVADYVTFLATRRPDPIRHPRPSGGGPPGRTRPADQAGPASPCASDVRRARARRTGHAEPVSRDEANAGAGR
jgi:hypothetical protein